MSAITMFRTAARQAHRLNIVSKSIATGSARFTSYFTPAHEYAKINGKIATVGITDFAQSALGDIVFVDLPEIGDEFEKGDSFGSVESVKAASDVYAPVSGVIVATNEDLVNSPDTVNQSPEDRGWFVKIEMKDESELNDLLDSKAYQAHCSSQK